MNPIFLQGWLGLDQRAVYTGGWFTSPAVLPDGSSRRGLVGDDRFFDPPRARQRDEEEAIMVALLELL